METTGQRGPGVENGSEWSISIGLVQPQKLKWSTSKGGTDPFSFRPKFPEILVEWIAPQNFEKFQKVYFNKQQQQLYFLILNIQISYIKYTNITPPAK